MKTFTSGNKTSVSNLGNQCKPLSDKEDMAWQILPGQTIRTRQAETQTKGC